jgi:hypothetical protein
MTPLQWSCNETWIVYNASSYTQAPNEVVTFYFSGRAAAAAGSLGVWTHRENFCAAPACIKYTLD